MSGSTVDVGHGLGSEAQWMVDPDVSVGRDATQVPLLVVETNCAGGRSAEGRISDEVSYTDETIVITIWVRALPGVQTCPGNPPTPYTVSLREPVGHREFVNGAEGEIARRPVRLPGTPTLYEQDGLRIAWPYGLNEGLNEAVVGLYEVANRSRWPLESVEAPLHPDGAELILGNSVERRTASRDELRQRQAWGFDLSNDPYAGRNGFVSVLDVLSGADFLVVYDYLGYLPCPGPVPLVPHGLEEMTRLRITGDHSGACTEFSWVEMYLDDDGMIRALQLHFWQHDDASPPRPPP